MLDLESEAMRGLGSIPTGGNIFSLDFFHVVKFCLYVKNRILCYWGRAHVLRKWFMSVVTFTPFLKRIN